VDQRQNIETIRRFYGAGPADEDTARQPFFHPEAVWHVPGANHVSGPYRGIIEITETMSQRMGSFEEWRIEPQDVMANDDLVVATVMVSGSRKGTAVVTPGAHVFRFDDTGLIVEAWGFTVDQAALDRLLDS
jgi:ketosteroid isomerase-like protein